MFHGKMYYAEKGTLSRLHWTRHLEFETIATTVYGSANSKLAKQ